MVPVIRGLGTALPTSSLSQTDSYLYAKNLSCENVHQSRALRQLYKKTGIDRRSTVLKTESLLPTDFFPERGPSSEHGPTTGMRMQRYSEEAGELASLSSMRALQDAEVSSERITHLITASCTGVGAPGFDLEIINSLALPRSVYRTHIGFMGCHGGMNALRVGAAFAAAPTGIGRFDFGDRTLFIALSIWLGFKQSRRQFIVCRWQRIHRDRSSRITVGIACGLAY